jgi:hypothetical protein
MSADLMTMPGLLYEAGCLADVLGEIKLERQDYGVWRVKETGTHWIEVVPMIYNWRVVRTPKSCPLGYDRGWCYQGTGPDAFIAAVLAAWAWDGSDETEPAGYFKRAGA